MSFVILKGKLPGTEIGYSVRLLEIGPRFQFHLKLDEHLPIHLAMKAAEKAGFKWGPSKDMKEKSVEPTLGGIPRSQLPLMSFSLVTSGLPPATVHLAPSEEGYQVNIPVDDITEALEAILHFIAQLGNVVSGYLKKITLAKMELTGALDKVLQKLEERKKELKYIE